ncbi:MAG TPA: right-handed parallel beta-helix repeat-containing protein, partial [Saprospiraceae bacterium]|nr:right-handed parallel beta-helix repeat-containing protein [Saprospiraceae bacterium]
MKKTALIALSTFLIGLSAAASNYHVKMDGSDSNNGLSFNTAFKTIQTATNKVVAGDTVFVYDGFYKGFDHFYKNSGTAGKEIVYLAAGANVVINQSCGRGFDGLNIEGSDYIQVIGFKVTRIADANGSGEDGIRAVLANHITIKHCEVDSCYRGIFTGYTDDFLAEYNICKRSYGEHGIYVSNNSDRVVIRYNVCFGNSRAAGIQLNPDLSSGAPGLSYQVSIYNNICYNNRIGLNLQGLYDSDVYNNLIYNNGLAGGGNGITLFHGDAATGCNNVRVYNNTVFVP